jgi:DNA helicase-2/ATP-dependent DNA helicase PcrA
MSKEVLINWLRQQKPRIEKVFVASAQEYYDNYSSLRTFPYDAHKTGKELWLLGSGADLCYDRPTIGFNYSLWYHPKRINTFLKYFTDLIYEARNESNIEIFDLGAGTGAVLWAVGLIAHGLKKNGMPCPQLRVVNIDTSAFMLMYNRHFLWKNFQAEFGDTDSISVSSEYKLNSWSNPENLSCTNVWLCASYLFDHSESREQITEDFKEVVTKYRPNKVLLLTAAKHPKPQFCDFVAEGIKALDFKDTTSTFTLKEPVFTGSLYDLYQFRDKISSEHNLELSGTPSWNIDSLYGRVLSNNQPKLNLDFNNLNLFIEPKKNRKEISLTSQQEDAAKIHNRPTLIIGPAGCGKSVVLTQKILNVIESTKVNGAYDTKLKILFTTFNKDLVKYIGDWVEQLLEPGTFTRTYDSWNGKKSSHSYFHFSNSKEVNIYVMHFDVLPTKIGNIYGYNLSTNGQNFEEFHLERMNNAIEAYVVAYNTDRKTYAKILDAEFLLEEYQRIIYGFECNNAKVYKAIERVGRGVNPQLRPNSVRREIVWGIINIYLRELHKNKLESFVMRRHRLIKKLRNKPIVNKFTHILVDEFQDCTKADYEIFYSLLGNPNNLTLAGDIAQSINLGSATHIPRSDDARMGRFLKKGLTGSFRLPFRVSECIRPLSERISKKFGEREGIKIDVISPYKGAPPGSRPIFVYATDVASAANKIEEIYNAYATALNIDKVSIFERHWDLYSSLYIKKIPCEANIILKTKGLEKSCVVWSTLASIDTKNEKEEFVYTILTRTVSLLIIVVYPNTEQDFLDIVKMLVPNRLIHWDEESETKYNELTNQKSPASNDIDEDNSEDSTNPADDNIDDFITE